jgi:hypothetical protein
MINAAALPRAKVVLESRASSWARTTTWRARSVNFSNKPEGSHDARALGAADALGQLSARRVTFMLRPGLTPRYMVTF